MHMPLLCLTNLSCGWQTPNAAIGQLQIRVNCRLNWLRYTDHAQAPVAGLLALAAILV